VASWGVEAGVWALDPGVGGKVVVRAVGVGGGSSSSLSLLDDESGAHGRDRIWRIFFVNIPFEGEK
jgi:hypothetical protein